ncbi:hypothetical protein PPACK8108_LOCUS23704 [Phakopsora pachyrhizi]|uniref:Secreted protein n=1 Tax=Phakopsora pachyrhizi TaxID=170000 RepID=A0AAV0BN31_PHAPC|nr:hypothetical protein PPACK8108_LOCUS23704 [Phakopsora pachyrhizi]
MKFPKSITHLCLAASKTILTIVAFSKGSPVKSLEDIFEVPRSPNPFSDHYNLPSHANNIPNIEKQPHTESHTILLSENTELTPPSMGKKKNFQEAFETGESTPTKLTDSEKELDLWPHFSCDWGSDLMFSNAEWDEVLNYSKEPQFAEIQYDFATTLKGSEYNYHDYNHDNIFFWENNDGLLQLPESSGTLSGTSLNGAAETQVPVEKNTGESSISVNLPLRSLNEIGRTFGLAENSYNALANDFTLAQQGEARNVHLEGHNSNDIFEIPSSLHFNQDSNISLKTITDKKQKRTSETVDLPILENQKSNALYLGKKNIAKGKILTQSSLNSPKNFVQPMLSMKDANNQLKVRKKYIKKISQSNKSLKDIIEEFKLKLEYRRKSSSTKSTIGLFLEALDNYADNMEIKKKDLNINIEKPFIRSFLGHSEFPLYQSLFDKLHEAFEKHSNEIDKESNKLFFTLIDDQIKRNYGKTFYINSYQVDLFFNSNGFNFKVESSAWKNVTNNTNYYLDQLAKTFGKAIGLIPWKSTFNSDNGVEIFEKRETYLSNSWIGKYVPEYGILPTQRFSLRKFFLAYSSLINKIFCRGDFDLIENFSDRQKAAVNFFDELVSNLEIDKNDLATYFIRNEKLPLNEDIKKIFLEVYGLTYPLTVFQFRIVNGNRSLWLAKDKYDYFIALYYPKNEVLSCFKNFFNSLFYHIIEASRYQ